MDNKEDILDDKTLEKIIVRTIERNGEKLTMHCAKACKGNRHFAEDLLQDVFVALWRGRHSTREGSSDRQPDHWLWAKTRTVTYDFLRDNRIEWVSIDQQPSLVEQGDPDDDTAADDETIAILLGALSPDEAKLMQMWIDGYTYTELAEMHNTTVAAMRKRFSRMYQKIREYAKKHNIKINR